MTDDGYAEYTSDDKANAAICANQFDHYVRDYVKRLYGDYIPDGYNIVVDELGIVLFGPDSSVDDLKIDSSPATFWEAWDQVGTMLDKIEQSIFETEKQILNDVCNALDVVGRAKSRTAFDLNTGTRYVPGRDKRLTQAIALEYWPGDPIAMYASVVDQLCNETTGILPKLNAHFSAYGSILIGQLDEMAASVCRDSRIGLGRYGPSEAVQDFARNLGNFLEELAGECTDTATNVRAVYNLYMQADADAIAALNAAANGGAIVGAVKDASAEEARAEAQSRIDTAGGASLLDGTTVTATNTGTQVTVTVKGTAMTFVPGLPPLTVSQTVTAPVERFTAP